MPINTELASKVWYRYAWARDNGHNKFIEKADRCEAFFRGDQWDKADKARLNLQRRPALTINKIISTISNVLGEQIYNRSEISYRPRSGAPEEVADALTKVFKYISDNNQLDWKRSDMFTDGIITSRGFLDMRMGFDDSMQGDIVVENLNPKNVIVDPDADDYDPDTWNEVFVTKWMTADDICILYNKKDGELLRNREQSFFPYGYDSIDAHRDRFGDRFNPIHIGSYDESSVMRNIRVIERQHRMLDKQRHFLSPETGDMRPIPENFDDERVAFFVKNFGFKIVPKFVHRIRWTVIADDVVLHDDWSPYKHFTVIPYFPYFRRGTTIGLVENLIGPQELLNKVSSQELHVVNTTANSGWIVKAGALVNMSMEELSVRGAETGLVLEVNSDGALEQAAAKITPNQVPQGLDRISYKAEEHIKSISGVPDSAQGFDREDVAAKAIQAKRQASATNIAKPLDSLVRTDYIFARNALDLVQGFMTEPRLLTITNNRITAETETIQVNQPTPEGTILNDLTLGEYDVVTSSVPQRETLEDSQFDQAIALRELGIEIPDSVLLDNSRLRNKADIRKQMDAASQSPEAQAQRQLALKGQAAEVAKTEQEAEVKKADAGLRAAKTQQVFQEIQNPQNDGGAELMKAEADIELEDRKFEHEKEIDYAKLAHEIELQRAKARQDAQLNAEKAATERAVRMQTAAQQAAPNPKKPQGAKK